MCTIRHQCHDFCATKTRLHVSNFAYLGRASAYGAMADNSHVIVRNQSEGLISCIA